jgi:hypothetical protein
MLRTGISAAGVLVVSVAAVLWSLRDGSPPEVREIAQATDVPLTPEPVEPAEAEPAPLDSRWPPYEEGAGEESGIGNQESGGQESEVGDQRSEVGGQRSEIGDPKPQISDLKSQISNPGSATESEKPTAQPAPSPTTDHRPPTTPPDSRSPIPDPPPPDPAIVQKIEARLAEPLAAIEFNQVPLSDLVDLLKDLTTLSISIDLPGLAEVGISPEDRVSAHLTNTTVAQVLDESLAPLKLGFVVDQQSVLITSLRRQRDSLSKVEYAVSDLAADNQALEELAGLCLRLVEPASWQAAGGKGTAEVAAGGLMINQNRAVHRQLQQTFGKLRLARGLSASDARLTLDTRRAQSRERLARPITANFVQETPLDKVLAHLARSANSVIVVDSAALADAGLSPETTTTLKAAKRPLSEALTTVLGPLGLSWRAVDDHTFQVTTQAAVGAAELEFHAAADLVGSEQTAAQLVERVGQALTAAGGDGMPVPVVHFDQPSGYLLVLASQREQAELGSLLNSWRTPADSAANPKLELK